MSNIIEVIDLTSDNEEEQEIQQADNIVNNDEINENVRENEDNDDVEVKDSYILTQEGESAGKGLFAGKDFKKNDYICDYDGVLILLDVAEDDNHESEYVFKLNSDWAIDAIHPYSCFGRYANDAIKRSKINAEIIKRNGLLTAELRAIKKIKNGDEIYVSYGDGYWAGKPFEYLNGDLQEILYNRSNEIKAFVDRTYWQN